MCISMVAFLYCAAYWSSLVLADSPRCRNIPGDLGFPSHDQWDQLNAQVSGRLITVVPTAKFCHTLPSGNCTSEQWASTAFRGNIPGSMNVASWEQDYASHPPSLCFQNGTTCGQGNVPVFAINASSVSDIQTGIKFAVKHNLKVAVKASGHDLLGRSTAKGSLLLWTHYLQNITFTDSFVVGGKDLGSAVTVGSGVPLNLLYTATKEAGKMFAGGQAANVVLAGGYIQGGGHSVFSPLLGLAADNALEFKIVIADGSFLTANEVENTDLFWALRGGGPGSWGVIISVTIRTFPIFSATAHTATIIASTNETAGQLTELHARHIFDWDEFGAGQFFALVPGSTQGIPGVIMALFTYFANQTVDTANAAMKPFLDDAKAMGFVVAAENATTALANDILFSPDDQLGSYGSLGSRLIPATAYRTNPSGIGNMYRFLLEESVASIGCLLCAGGKVAANANISSAITPKWRTAKTHVITSAGWGESTSLAEIERLKRTLTDKWVPALAAVTGERDSGSYMNEADVREPNFQVTFFGPNFGQLLKIKKKYDPNGLFIVGAGVGSEDWDEAGLCRK